MSHSLQNLQDDAYGTGDKFVAISSVFECGKLRFRGRKFRLNENAGSMQTHSKTWSLIAIRMASYTKLCSRMEKRLKLNCQ